MQVETLYEVNLLLIKDLVITDAADAHAHVTVSSKAMEWDDIMTYVAEIQHNYPEHDVVVMSARAVNLDHNHGEDNAPDLRGMYN